MKPVEFYIEARIEFRDAVGVYWGSGPRVAGEFEQAVRDSLDEVAARAVHPGNPPP